MENTKHFPKWNLYKAVELYVLTWSGIAIVFFVFLAIFHTSVYNAIFWIPMVFIFYRMFDISQSWVSQFVLGGVPKPGWEPRDIYRSLVLVFIGYFETTLSYAFIALFFSEQFQGIECWQHAVYYSVRNATTMGTDYHPVTLWGYIIFFTQVMFILLFLTAVVNTIISHTAKR